MPCRITLSYMKNTLTIRLDKELDRTLSEVSRRSGRTRSDVVREALKRQLALVRFDQLRKKVLPFAEARGLLTDEDIFKSVS